MANYDDAARALVQLMDNRASSREQVIDFVQRALGETYTEADFERGAITGDGRPAPELSYRAKERLTESMKRVATAGDETSLERVGVALERIGNDIDQIRAAFAFADVDVLTKQWVFKRR